MRILVMALLLLLAAGCVPVSLHTICKDDDNRFDPQFVGRWDAHDGIWELSGGKNVTGSHPDPAGGPEYVMEYDAYDVTYTESGKSSNLHGRLTEIGGVTFMDLTPAMPDEDPGGHFVELMLMRPLHTWVKIAIVDGKLDMTPVSLDWLNTELAQHPSELPVIYADDADWPIITGSTLDLRAFVERHMHDEGFFGEMSDFTKLGPPSKMEVQSGNANYDLQYRSATPPTKQTYESK